MNVLVEYLYRDAGNNKIWASITFSNRENLSINDLDSSIRRILIDGEFFCPHIARVPVLRFERYDSDLDHDWHEYHGIQQTDGDIDDLCHRDICQFMDALGSWSSPQ